MYEPNVFPIEIAKMLAGNPVDQVKTLVPFPTFETCPCQVRDTSLASYVPTQASRSLSTLTRESKY